MRFKKIDIYPRKLFLIYFFSFLIAFYFIHLFYMYFVPVYFLIRKKKLIFLIIFAGFLSGNLFSGLIIHERESSYSGLEIDRIQFIEIRVKEDSFLSTQGRRIVKASLVSVKDSGFYECSASGDLLLIGNDTEPLYWGEIITIRSSLKLLNDSKEFPFIAYSNNSPLKKKWQNPYLALRKSAKIKLENNMSIFPRNASALFSALFTGNRDHLSGNIKENFRKSGVSHLLALSGFHIAIIVFIFTWLLKMIVGRRVALLLSIPFLLLYLFITGPSPSLLRAIIMFLVGGYLIFINKKMEILYLLMISCLLQLAFTPVQGWSLSFQLSYMALAGILTIGKRVNFYLQPLLPGFIRLPFCASLGAHLLTAPLIIYQFREIYPQGIISSLIITPLIVMFMWITIFVFLLSLLFLPDLLIHITEILCNNLLEAISWCVKSFAEIEGIVFSSYVDIIIYLSLVTIIVVSLYIELWSWHGRRKSPEFKLRFSKGNKSPIGNNGLGAQEKMEPEFFNQ